MMFKGSKFCPHCGAVAQDPQIGPSVAHACPLCRGQLASVTIGRATLEECVPCLGIWIGVGEFNAICADAEAQVAAMALPMQPTSSDDFTVRYLKCPTCGELMNRVNYAHASGVIINTCKQHGIWFDHDGLRRVIEFIRNGGLQKAQAREAEEVERETNLAKQAAYFDSINPQSISTYFGGSDPNVMGALSHIIGSIMR